jgi:hypothetical protein
MEKLSKKQNKHLRELAGRAYEIELSKKLAGLHEQFEEWKAGTISVWDLSDLIHAFHDKDAREIYKFYVYGKKYQVQVAHAIHSGHLSIEDVEESCRRHVLYYVDNLYGN